ncbi:MAG TPA: hypothetical protein DHN29_22830 [Cytophagales bacterium]|nr:hypothetical protein [Cytophagales bacterium]|tara:strand:- start:2029 stop:2502 length:474 start_codon:yes stop_codon:yes gene_type:complete
MPVKIISDEKERFYIEDTSAFDPDVKVKLWYRRCPHAQISKFRRQCEGKRNRFNDEKFHDLIFGYCILDWEDGFFEYKPDNSRAAQPFPYTPERAAGMRKNFPPSLVNEYLEMFGISETGQGGQEGVFQSDNGEVPLASGSSTHTDSQGTTEPSFSN